MAETITVLLVDDEEYFRNAVKKFLAVRGFRVILAESGEAGLETLAEQPDIVILDIKMPGMGGHKALKEIKKRNPDIPVIILTDHDTLSAVQQAYEEGAIDCLSKPCDLNLLAAKIRSACYKGEHEPDNDEKRVMGVMIPLKEYSVVNKEITVREAIQKLRERFISGISTNRIMETSHRSVLVADDSGNVHGILTIKGLLAAITSSCDADSADCSITHWKGLFTREVNNKADMKIKDIMSPAPPTIDGAASLMEAAYMMMKNNVRRLVVLLRGKPIGVIREQDLFFEMERILKR